MKKLLALFAAVVALCLLCTCAIAEEAPVEEIEEFDLSVFNAETAGDVVSESDPDKTTVKDDETITPVDTTDSDGKPHTDKVPDNVSVVEVHKGEKIDFATMTDGVDYITIHEADCGKNVLGIYWFPCQEGITDNAGNVVWHEYVVAPVHKWASENHETNADWGIVITEPTCTEPGLRRDYCLLCGKTRKEAGYEDKDEKIDPLGHSYENINDMRVAISWTDPSCKWTDAAKKKHTDGTIEFTCVICGQKSGKKVTIPYDEVVDLIEIKPGQNKPDPMDAYVDDTATTTKDASKDIIPEKALLQVVDAKMAASDFTWTEADREAYIKAHKGWSEHKWDSWVTSDKPGSAATCCNEGTQVRWCTHCGIKVERKIPALTANYKMDKSLTKVIDCYHEVQVFVCQNCKGKCDKHPNKIVIRRVVAHEKDERVAAMIDAAIADPTVTEYTYNGRQVYQAPTCEEAGWVIYLCKHEAEDPHEFKLDTLPEQFVNKDNLKKDGEVFYDGKAANPTYWEIFKGTDAQMNAVIGEKWSYHFDEITVDKIDEVLVSSVPGLKAYTEAKYKEAVTNDKTARTKHAYDINTTVKKTTPKEYYIDEVTPANSYFGESIKALGHKWSNWYLRYDIDNNEEGNKTGYWTRVCERCGKTEEMIASENPACKDSHKWVLVSSKKATCTEDGETVYRCSVCGTPKTETSKATGHTIVVDAAVEATTEHPGLTEGKHCSVCGEVLVKQEVIDKIVPNKYNLDLDDVKKESATSGEGKVTKTEGNQPTGDLYARITWVYDLSDGSSYAFCWSTKVEEDGSFDMTSANCPAGATLKDVQVALVTVPKSHQIAGYGEFALDFAKK